MRALRKCCCVIGLLAVVGATNASSGPEQALAEMDHRTWTARDGAPQGIRALAEGADGTLWVGSASGLYRFDGRAFSPFRSPAGETELPIDAVSTLWVARDGTLWVGFFDAGIARVRDGRVTVYASAGEQQLRVVKSLREARDGSIWATSAQASVVRFGADQEWHEEPIPDAAAGGRVFAALDSADILWVSQKGRLYRRDIRESRYTETNVPNDWLFGFTEVPDGSFWIADYDGEHGRARLQHVDRLGRLIGELPEVGWTAYHIAYRSDGSLIYASQTDGLLLLSREMLAGERRAATHPRPEAFAHSQGLSANAASALLRASDGTLWVGTPAGLDRFRAALFRPLLAERKAGDWTVCANEQGEVWVAHSEGELRKVVHGVTRIVAAPGDVQNVFCGNDGYTWLVAPNGIWSAHGEKLTFLPPMPGVKPYGIAGVVATSDHTLFAKVGGTKTAGGGVWQYKDGTWTRLDGPVFGKRSLVIYLDREDRLWMGLRDEIGLPTATGGETFSAAGIGLVYALLETSHGFFAAGAGGLAVHRGSRFEMLSFEDSTFTRALNGLVEAGNGDLWLNAARGIVRIPARELEAGLANPSYRMKAELVTEGDFTGGGSAYYGDATAARDADGKLWFASRNGPFSFDPAQRTAGGRPPILTIRSIAADRIPLGPGRSFEPRPQTLEVRYFGAHLADPDRVIYKYRLAGLEDSWQEAGARTEAVYTRLPPGTYTFHVMASSGNDVWTQPVSSAPFVVLPSFYQTSWFRVLCIAAALLLIFAIITLRVRALTRGIRARAEERADERIRIARELHDTLLQGVQGLLLNFHVAAQKLAPDDASKAMLERSLSTADRIILEGRNRVSSLRSEQLTDAELVASIENAGIDLRSDANIEFTVTRSGSAATLTPHVADEIFWIAREALANAFRHASATRIALELHYGARYFRMNVTDNGRGFDASNGEKEGHWGLRGMTERARRLGGQLRVHSSPTDGTQIVVSVPSYRAYKNHSRVLFYLRALQPDLV